jgi:hypothetical protein
MDHVLRFMTMNNAPADATNARPGSSDDCGVPVVTGMDVPIGDETVVGRVVLVGTGVGHGGHVEGTPVVGVRASVDVTSGNPRSS